MYSTETAYQPTQSIKEMQEKKLQDKLRKVNAASPEKPEKDW